MLPAYVIHAKSLPERTDHIQRELDRASIQFEWVLDFDANEITPEVDAAYFAPGADLTMRQKSCALKPSATTLLSLHPPGVSSPAVVQPKTGIAPSDLAISLTKALGS